MMTKIERRNFIFGIAAAGLVPAAAVADENGGPRRVRIAHMTDPQFGFGRTAQDHEANYAADLARFERAVARVNALKPDLALITGDMTHRPEDVVRDWPRLLGMFEVPVAVAPGNHDMGQKVSKENRDRYLSVFGSDYRALDVKGWRIIVGNTQFWRETDLTAEKERYEAWLKDELGKAKAFGGRVILAGHIPPFTDRVEEPDSYENCAKESRRKRLDAYLAAGARFFLAGHTHRMIAHGWKELTILNAETTSWNFDRRPYGFRLFEAACETDCSYSFVEV
jgi:3',5'-cyclic AMP phosphodiesterase CpdA